ncbi:MAG TPA: hypothetical protein VJ822_08115 [Dongiaceae bacterium]|nr:hypothetical protein [Dongiaceae bacterium]
MPAALAAGLIVQTVSYWPLPLLDWTDAIGAGLFIDYAILTVNVLAFDVLFFVLLPVLLAEKQPLIGTFRRGIRLAMYHPWRILAVDAGLWIAYFVLDEPISQAYYMIDAQWATLAWNGMTTLLFVLIISLSCCLSAATYHLIRSEHEGPAPEVMARVFD